MNQTIQMNFHQKMSVYLSFCLSVSLCVYVCSQVEKLFLNRFSSMICPQTRIHNRKESPKTDLKYNRMLKSYLGKT